MKDLIIKVCGMRDADNIRQVAALGVDMIGMVFCRESPRYVGMIPSLSGMLPDYSEERLHQIESGAGRPARHRPMRVGVFRDDMPQTIIAHIYNYGLDYVQLHGDESPVMIDNLRRSVVPDLAPRLGIIKTISVASEADLARTAEYEGVADYLLFDTACAEGGGSGRPFDWQWLGAYRGQTPFLLSGGIGPEDVGRIRALNHPMLAGVDVNSRFETAPAMKDVALVRQLVAGLLGD